MRLIDVVPNVHTPPPRTVGVPDPYFEPTTRTAALAPVWTCESRKTGAPRPGHVSRFRNLYVLLLAIQREPPVEK